MPGIDKTSFNSFYSRGSENLEFTQITVDIDDKSNLEYIPHAVHKIHTTHQNSITDFSGDDVLINQFVVLTNQQTDRAGENGLYKQTAANTASKVTLIKDTFFLDVSSEFKRAIYLKNSDNYFQVNFNKVLLGTSISTTSGNTTPEVIFNYPVPYSRSAVINTNIFGIGTNDKVMFDGQYKIVYYNDAGTIRKLDNFSTTTRRSVVSGMSIPTVEFGTSTGTSGGTLSFTSGAGNVQTFDWFIRSEMTF
jgi:hypothetical protein